MSELLRKVNDPLRLKLHLEPKDDTYFVKAKVTTAGGGLINEVELPNVGDGVYQDDLSEIMPNLPEVWANYFVFYDALFTEEACEHGDFEVYKRDDFDPKTLVSGAIRVRGVVKDNKIIAKIGAAGKIKAIINDGKIAQKVSASGTVKATIKSNTVKGVVYE